jgi:hypothetical protein
MIERTMTMRPAADIGPVERLHEHLTRALERTRSEPFAAPVTVAEIYQELIPYRSVRSEVGFSMNADYEHALLRLLAGDAALAELDPVEARERIQRELDSTNPDVSLYREFAACEVWLKAPGATQIVRPPVLELDAVVPPAAASPGQDTAGAPDSRTAAGAQCISCNVRLPRRPGLCFCPYCGAEQAVRPCAECGQALEPGWAYCAACGAAAPSSGGANGG